MNYDIESEVSNPKGMEMIQSSPLLVKMYYSFPEAAKWKKISYLIITTHA